MIWVKQEKNKEKLEELFFGMEPEKCKNIGHVSIGQYNHNVKEMYHFCVNCGIELKQMRQPVY